MPGPLFFISHKHADSEIAKVIAKFIRTKSGGRVSVYLSSDPSFRGPDPGAPLTPQLRKALWEAKALILIYTSADQDWQFCMWECGVATDSQNPDPKIFVFQCGRDIPAPFADIVRINAQNLDDLRRFTNMFLLAPNFFPGQIEAVAPGFDKQDADNAAEELFVGLEEVIPRDEGPVEEWRAWPYMRIELPSAEVQRMENDVSGERSKLALEVVKKSGVIADSDGRASQLFGMSNFPSNFRVADLIRMWKNRSGNADDAWFVSCCEQIMVGSQRGFPMIRRAPIGRIEGGAQYTPVLSRVKRIPSAKKVQFDVYFYNLADPRAVAVTSKMLPTGRFFTKNLGQTNLDALGLGDLVAELEKRGVNRVPFVNESGHLTYIVHRSMIDQFIAKQALDEKKIADLTLADLLAEPTMRKIFEETFGVVSTSATLAEAKAAMLSITDCRDVFVTAQGDKNEPVLGWLTNVDMDENR